MFTEALNSSSMITHTTPPSPPLPHLYRLCPPLSSLALLARSCLLLLLSTKPSLSTQGTAQGCAACASHCALCQLTLSSAGIALYLSICSRCFCVNIINGTYVLSAFVIDMCWTFCLYSSFIINIFTMTNFLSNDTWYFLFFISSLTNKVLIIYISPILNWFQV